MRSSSQNMKTRSSSDQLSVHERESHIDKTKCKSYQTYILFINRRVTFTNRTRAYDIRVDYSTSKEVQVQNPSCSTMEKAILREKGASCGRVSPITVGAVAELDGEVTCFSFGAISTVESSKRLKKKSLSFFWV